MKIAITLLLSLISFQSIAQTEPSDEMGEQTPEHYIKDWDESNCRPYPDPREFNGKKVPHGFLLRANNITSSYVCFQNLRFILIRSWDAVSGYKVKLEFIDPSDSQKRRYCFAKRTDAPVDPILHDIWEVYRKKFREMDEVGYNLINKEIANDKDLIDKLDKVYELECEESNS